MNVEHQKTELADCVSTYLDKWFTEDDARRCIIQEMSDNLVTSPPEQLFYAAWSRWQDDYTAGLSPQQPVGNYFVDFTVSTLDHFINHQVRFTQDALVRLSAVLPRYAIEIDGFEWHDRTREQAEADKKRERFIQSHGYIVLRFAAREVIRDVDACGKEVRDRLRHDLESIYAKFVSALQGESCLTSILT